MRETLGFAVMSVLSVVSSTEAANVIREWDGAPPSSHIIFQELQTIEI